MPFLLVAILVHLLDVEPIAQPEGPHEVQVVLPDLQAAQGEVRHLDDRTAMARIIGPQHRLSRHAQEIVVAGQVAGRDERLDFLRRRQRNVAGHEKGRLVGLGPVQIDLPAGFGGVVRQGMQEALPDVFVEGVVLLEQVQGALALKRAVGVGEGFLKLRGIADHEDAVGAAGAFNGAENVRNDRCAGHGQQDFVGAQNRTTRPAVSRRDNDVETLRRRQHGGFHFRRRSPERGIHYTGRPRQDQ